MWHDLLFRLRSLFRRDSMEFELEDEVTFHIERETERLIGTGVPADEAALQARRAFGGREQMKERCRDARGTRLWEEFGRDVAFGMRMLRQQPAFTAVAVLSLALGIGVNTAMFQLLDVIQLRQLPVAAPKQLHFIYIKKGDRSGNFTSRHSEISWAQWEQVRRQQQAFSSIATLSVLRFNLAPGGEVRPAEGMMVSGSFFETLGIGAQRGRLLDSRDDTPGCGSASAVISDSFWHREYGGSGNAIGQQIRVDGHPFTVVGVTPPGFFGVEVGRFYDVAVPLCAEGILKAAVDNQMTASRDNYWLVAIGRLRPEWSVERANAHLAAISPAVFQASLPRSRADEAAKRKFTESTKAYLAMKLGTRPAGQGMSWLRVSYQKPLWLLLASAGLVLLIACGNLANLLLARATARTHEIAVRIALGASAGRIVRQLLTESLILAFAGATCGLLVATIANGAILSFLVTNDDPVALATGIEWRVLAFSAMVALLTCLLFGLAPAIQSARVRAVSAPTAERSLTSTHGRSLFRGVLVGAQVALSVVLIAGALLFGRSLYNVIAVDLGFRPDHILVTSLDTRRLGYDEDRQKILIEQLLQRLRATPGVSAVAQANIIPMSGWESNINVRQPDGRFQQSRFSPVSAGYFATLGTPLLAGREFGREDTDKSECVAVINQSFARKFFQGSNGLERSFASPFRDGKLCRVVGLAKDAKYRELQEDFQPVVYFPASQVFFGGNYARFVVRSALPAADVTRAVRDTVAQVSPAIDIDFLRLETQLKESVVRERLLAAIAGGFGVLAAILAAVGLYGVLSYSVAMRRREIGIRMALGADRSVVLMLVLRQAGILLGAGVAAGAILTRIATPAAKSLLYGLTPHDPVTLIAAVLFLSAVGLFASYVPARRAAQLDPVTALNQD